MTPEQGRALSAQVSLSANDFGISGRQLRESGFYHVLDEVVSDDPMAIGRECIRLAVGTDDWWDPAAPAFIKGAIGFMAACGFNLPSRVQLRALQEIQQRQPADEDALILWFDETFGA